MSVSYIGGVTFRLRAVLIREAMMGLSWVYHPLSLGFSIVSVPLYIVYLGNKMYMLRYGFLSTVSVHDQCSSVGSGVTPRVGVPGQNIS